MNERVSRHSTATILLVIAVVLLTLLVWRLNIRIGDLEQNTAQVNRQINSNSTQIDDIEYQRSREQLWQR